MLSYTINTYLVLVDATKDEFDLNLVEILYSVFVAFYVVCESTKSSAVHTGLLLPTVLPGTEND